MVYILDDEGKNDKPKPDEKADIISLVDEEADSSLNIISVINEVLQNSKRASRRQPRRSVNNPPNQVVKKPTKLRKRTRARVIEYDLSEDPEPTNVIKVNLTEEDHDQIVVKVCWCFQSTEKFSVGRFESVEKIFQHFATRHNIPENRLLFTLDNSNQVISPTDTPDFLKLNVGSIIEGGFLNSEQQDCAEIRPKTDELELKVQLKDTKRPLLISMRTTDSMEVFMRKCADQLSVSVNELKFYFDGDAIQFSDTAISLDLSGGECIDCVRNISG